MSALKCDRYDHGDDSAKWYLRAAKDIDCDSDRYKRIVLPIGIVGVLVYPTLVILAYAVVLYRYRATLGDTLPVAVSWAHLGSVGHHRGNELRLTPSHQIQAAHNRYAT